DRAALADGRRRDDGYSAITIPFCVLGSRFSVLRKRTENAERRTENDPVPGTFLSIECQTWCERARSSFHPGGPSCRRIYSATFSYAAGRKRPLARGRRRSFSQSPHTARSSSRFSSYRSSPVPSFR